ncbi:hypothetical protein NDU88_006311 [Pleurodeles waltl]|uniref:Uncharacterized protein n=1 Tax=Pleurodeles waltl TaxID=8319 RepID=A0AAV7MFD9_PLEWA|nr:hypothetical protein NDU88_006311 [Pleurodeles waltl]
MPWGGVTKCDPYKVTPVAWGVSTNPPGCWPAPRSPASLLDGGAGFTPSRQTARAPTPLSVQWGASLCSLQRVSRWDGAGPPIGVFFRWAPEPAAGSSHHARPWSQRRPRALRDRPQ